MRETRGVAVFRIITVTVLTIFAVLPLYIMVSTSFKPLTDVADSFSWIPSTLTIRPYIDMWSTVPLAQYFANSLLVSVVATVLSVTIAIFAGYAVSRFRFRGSAIFRSVILSTQMFPGILFLLPLFVIFVDLNRATGIVFVGSPVGLIITYLTFSLPFSIWMLVGYFEGIPRDLDEAALVDGNSPVGALVRIVLPAAAPGVVAVAIFSFMTAWGEVLFASVMTTAENRTLAVGLQQYSSLTTVYWNQIMAASVLVSIPVVVGFLLLQRFFVAGLTAGAIK